MTSVRRSLEQTIARLAMRTLRERAQLAGTPAARSDAPAALAALLDQTWNNPDQSLALWCAQAVAHGFGRVMLPQALLAAAADHLLGSQVLLGTSLDLEPTSVAEVLRLGAQEISVRLTVAQLEAADLPALVAALHEQCRAAQARLSFELDHLTLSPATLTVLRQLIHDHDVALRVSADRDRIATLRHELGVDAGITALSVTTLDAAREMLHAGATRIGTSVGAELVGAAQPGGAPERGE